MYNSLLDWTLHYDAIQVLSIAMGLCRSAHISVTKVYGLTLLALRGVAASNFLIKSVA